MRKFRIPLRVVFYREEGRWIAHCLEFDAIGDGATKPEALDCLSEAIRGQLYASVKYDNPANLFTPADGKYFEMFAVGKDAVVGELRVEIEPLTVSHVECREYVEDDLEPAMS